MRYIEERKIEMPYGAEVAFHCQKCGGTTDEYGKCHFCGSQNVLRYKPRKAMQLYIELDKHRKFYFNHAETMEYTPQNDFIDITMLEDTTRKLIRDTKEGIMKFEGLATDDSLFKMLLMQESRFFTVNGIMSGTDKVLRFRVDYVTDWKYKQKEINDPFQKIELDMYVHDMDGWVGSLTTPEGAICPNCGARLNKLCGVCDYCGGWVEYR